MMYCATPGHREMSIHLCSNKLRISMFDVHWKMGTCQNITPAWTSMVFNRKFYMYFFGQLKWHPILYEWLKLSNTRIVLHLSDFVFFIHIDLSQSVSLITIEAYRVKSWPGSTATCLYTLISPLHMLCTLSLCIVNVTDDFFFQNDCTYMTKSKFICKDDLNLFE